jgi:PKD repeat protein
LRKNYTYIFFLLLHCTIYSGSTYGQNEQFYFVENQGQWAEDFDFKLDYGNGSVFLEGDALTFHLIDAQAQRRRYEAIHSSSTKEVEQNQFIQHHAYKVTLEGADMKPMNQGSNRKEQYHNYFTGRYKKNWKGRVPLYGAVSYYDVYQNIDMKYYFTTEGNMKYDFIVNPGAEVNDISLLYEGVDSMYLAYGNLIVKNSVEDVLESAPYAYQIVDGKEKEIKSEYRLKNNRITFKLGRYNKNYPLIIDPVLVFSSFTGSAANNFGYTATPGADGSLYAGGIAFMNDGNYPTTLGAFSQSQKGGDIDIVITKFSPSGESLIYSTYLGGISNEMPHSMIENSLGELIVFGNTGSFNFPISANAFQDSMKGGNKLTLFGGVIDYDNGVDIFVAKFNADGSKLLGSSFVGGSRVDGINTKMSYNYGDFYRGEVALDSNNNIYVATCTQSVNFPTQGASVPSAHSGFQDGVAFSLSPDLAQMRWGRYIGGNDDDAMLSLKATGNGKVVVTGGTESNNLPMPDSSTYQVSSAGGVEGYTAVLNSNNGKIEHSTYNGSSVYNMNFFVDVDYEGAIYLFGQTRGPYPLVGEAGNYIDSNSSQFLHKLDTNLHTTYKSTVFGSGSFVSNISPTAFMVDDCKNIYASGWGGVNNSQGNTQNMPLTKNALQQNTDGNDFFLLVMDATWKKLNYSSYFGSINGTEHVDGGTSRFKKDGTIYQAVCAGCMGNNNFPVSINAFSKTNGSSTGCNMAAVKLKMETQKVIAEVELDVDSACIPFKASVNNLSYNADFFVWKDENGTMDTLSLDTLTIANLGATSYKMYAIDTTCSLIDSTVVNLYGFSDSLVSDFQAQFDSCAFKHMVDFKNTSFNASKFVWDFGDGTTSNEKNPKHEYQKGGTYQVKLISENNSCGTIDSVYYTFTFIDRDQGTSFFYTYEPCADTAEVFLTGKGKGFHQFLWEFEDGSSLIGEEVRYLIPNKGKFDVKLTVKDTICQREFTSFQTIN